MCVRLIVLLGLVLCLAHPEVEASPQEADSDQAEQQSSPDSSAESAVAFELSDEVRDVLQPLFALINKADISRVTVEFSADSVVQGEVVETRTSTYQIASKYPNQFTVYLKEPDQRTRIYSNGQDMVVALAPDAYFRIDDTMHLADAVANLPVPMGPYPEPVMALSFAGVDPSLTFLGGMKSLVIVDRGMFRGRVPATHLRGVQNDQVSWDLWISRDDETPKPLRLQVDLTPMLRATNQVQVPVGFTYLLRFDFLAWRFSGDVDESLFTFTPSKDAKEYQSIQDYRESIAGAVTDHPMLGEKAPSFEAKTLEDQTISLQDLKDKVVVLDFWASWCAPCVAAMPVIQQVCDEYKEKDVVFLAVNVGEQEDVIRQHLDKHPGDYAVLLDPESEISKAFEADAIPQTVVIGKSGIIESVHLGFPGEEPLKQRLQDELSVLSIGGRIENTGDTSEEPTQTQANPEENDEQKNSANDEQSSPQ